MRKKDFNKIYQTSGLEEALKALLKETPEHEIVIPKEEYLPKNAINKIDPKAAQRWKIMYAIEKSYSCTIRRLTANDNDQYQGIAAIQLVNGSIRIETYHIYGLSMQHPTYTDLSSLYDLVGVERFILKWAKFDEPSITSAADLTDRQLELLDEFTEAARRLNEAGVSLIWDEDGNNLCVANRDQMKDESYFRLELDQELPEGAERLSEKASNAIDVEIHTMSEDYDLYYFPQE